MKAYHIIGQDYADIFKIRDKAMTEEEFIEKQKGRYTAILNSGVLKASHNGPSRRFSIDALAKDDQYVFFSVGERLWSTPTYGLYGFVYDPIHLIRRHKAILRMHDLLNDYEDLLGEVVHECIPFKKRGAYTKEEQELWLQQGLSPNEMHYELTYAIERGDMMFLFAQKATELLCVRMKALQEQTSFTEDAAIERLEEKGVQELLVRESVSLQCCVGVIEEGQYKPVREDYE